VSLRASYAAADGQQGPSKERASTCSRSGMVKPPYGSMPGMGSLRVDGEIVWEILFHLKIGRADVCDIWLEPA
jgi:hypothetical protein